MEEVGRYWTCRNGRFSEKRAKEGGGVWVENWMITSLGRFSRTN